MHFGILKMIAASGFLTALECNKFDFDPEPRTPLGGAYIALPDPLAGLRGLLLREGKERGGKGAGKEGRGGREGKT